MHVPLRRCRVCRTVKPKSELMRWVVQDGMVRDETQTVQARGQYTCSHACADKLLSKRTRVKP